MIKQDFIVYIVILLIVSVSVGILGSAFALLFNAALRS